MASRKYSYTRKDGTEVYVTPCTSPKLNRTGITHLVEVCPPGWGKNMSRAFCNAFREEILQILKKPRSKKPRKKEKEPDQ